MIKYICFFIYWLSITIGFAQITKPGSAASSVPVSGITGTGTGVNAALANAVNGSAGLVSNDLYGNTQINTPYSLLIPAYNVICMGDSLTLGQGATRNDDGFTAIMASSALFRNSQVFACGVSGGPTSLTQYTTTSAQYPYSDTTDARNWITTGAAFVPDNKSFGITGTTPSIGVIYFGTNDALGTATTANTTGGNAVIVVASASGLSVGMKAYGANIAQGVTITVISGLNITLSVAPVSIASAEPVGFAATGNDATWLSTYQSLVNAMLAHNSAVFIGTLVQSPPADTARFPYNGHLIAMNNLLKATYGGAAYGGSSVANVYLADLSGIPQFLATNTDQANFFNGSVHWSSEGHRLVADYFLNLMQSVLATSASPRKMVPLGRNQIPDDWLSRNVWVQGRSVNQNVYTYPPFTAGIAIPTWSAGSGEYLAASTLTVGGGDNFNAFTPPGTWIRIGGSPQSGVVLSAPSAATAIMSGSYNGAAGGSTYNYTKPVICAPNGTGITGAGTLLAIQGDSFGFKNNVGPFYMYDGTLGVGYFFESNHDLDMYNSLGTIFAVYAHNALANALQVTSAGIVSAGTITDSGGFTLASRAPSASPTFTGIPAAPTAAVGTSTTQLATTAFVLANSSPANSVSANLTGQTAAVASVTTFTPSALGTYRIGAYLNVTARSLDVVQVSVTYTDETATAQTVNLSGLVAATGVTNISPVDIRAANGTAIIVKTVLTTGGGSIAYDIGANIQPLGY